MNIHIILYLLLTLIVFLVHHGKYIRKRERIVTDRKPCLLPS